jgi:hypothetical protein
MAEVVPGSFAAVIAIAISPPEEKKAFQPRNKNNQNTQNPIRKKTKTKKTQSINSLQNPVQREWGKKNPIHNGRIKDSCGQEPNGFVGFVTEGFEKNFLEASQKKRENCDAASCFFLVVVAGK